ncbi:MAG: sialate O-acetylesterase [Verrucomicrobiota bacterium JB024]|nr:sialate O-acetylesterase [Verrucomicrobiota bacterium JB024]
MPHETVKVEIAGVTGHAVANDAGNWRVTLDLSGVDSQPHEMTIVAGDEVRVVSDVLVGEVWIGSGQSNMEWPLELTTDAEQELARPENPLLRFFTVAKVTAPQPLDSVEGKWVLASPAALANLSATGYYFSRNIQVELGTPVGFINASWGGSPVEAWTSMESLVRDEELGPRAASITQYHADFPALTAAFKKSFGAWCQQLSRQDIPQGQPEDYNRVHAFKGPWEKVKLPGLLADSGAPDAGAFWVKKTIQIPYEMDGLQQSVHLGRISGFCQIYWNGELIREVSSETGAQSDIIIYTDPSIIHEGEATLAIRIFNPGSGTGIFCDDFCVGGSIPLSGDWDLFVEKELAPLTVPELEAMPMLPLAPVADYHTATFTYNGMIAPVIPYAIRGVIWFQGETNVTRAWQYRRAFPLLIEDWRAKWQQGDLPFFFCQLANFEGKVSDPNFPEALPELREAQSLALTLPETGQAVLIDVGEEGDIHFRNKTEVGYRLAQIALARVYGRDREYSGPVYESHRQEGKVIRLAFTHADSGLVAKPLPNEYLLRTTGATVRQLKRNSPGSELEGFAICGADRKWYWADARVEGNSVVVSSPDVPVPTAVRYAWASNPTCNLYNQAGFPAAPFRTDDFELSTVQVRY